ncbi:hypothetical protein ACWGB8_07735 [Kitasatospora sp. NPDC054939]
MAVDRPRPLPSLSLSAWTWIDSTPEGLVSFVLVTPEGATGSLGPIAEQAGLAVPTEPLPAPGIRLVLQDRHAVVLLPGGAPALRVPADEGWADFVRRGGTVVVVLGTHPLAPDSGRIAVEQYLLTGALSREIWLGKSTLAADYSPQQVRAEACVRCGGTVGPFVPDGYAYTPVPPGSAPLGWAVVAHPGPCPGPESSS